MVRGEGSPGSPLLCAGSRPCCPEYSPAVAVLGRLAVLAFDAGFSDAEVKRAVSDVQLQIAALRDPLMVGVKRTWHELVSMSANDPKRTS